MEGESSGAAQSKDLRLDLTRALTYLVPHLERRTLFESLPSRADTLHAHLVDAASGPLYARIPRCA